MKWMNYDCIIRNGRNENTKSYNEWRKSEGFFFFLWALFYLLLRDVYDICLWKNSTVGKFE